MEFIKNLRYDVFLVYAGAILIGGISWLYIQFNPSLFKELTSSGFSTFIYILVIWAGLYFIAIGLSELRDNYLRTKDLQIRQYRLDRHKLDKNLKELPREYLKGIAFF